MKEKITTSTAILTDIAVIKKALCLPKSMPDACVAKFLSPVGEAKYKGDNLSPMWSANDFFTKGETYPIYDYEGEFAIGSDGVGKKMTPVAWGRVKYF